MTRGDRDRDAGPRAGDDAGSARRTGADTGSGPEAGPDREPGAPAGGDAGPSLEQGRGPESGATWGPKGDLDSPLGRRLREELAPDLDVLRPLGPDRPSRVFLGRDRALARLVAVKALDPACAESPTAARRFEREARSIAALSHPDVVNVHRFGGLSDDTPYLVMQYVPGRSAEERLAAEGPLPAEAAIRILATVAAALEAVHDEGIVHRDVRPGNFLLEEKTDRVVLAGFGIAALLPGGDRDVTALTAENETLGVPDYLSPEQLRGEPVSDRTDVYALGVSAWFLLTGQGPYGERTPREIVSAHLKEEPRSLAGARPDLDPALAEVLRRCLAKEPGHRPTAAHLAERLADPARPSGEAVVAPPGILGRLRRRHLFQIVGGYVAVGFAVLQGVDQLVGQAILPRVAYRLALATGLAGVPAAAILGWYHGEKGAQRVQPAEVALLLAVGATWLAAILWILLR